MRYLLALILLAGSLGAATITNYTPTAMKVAVGAFYCNVYFHYPGNKWDFEVACYDMGGTPTYAQVNTPTTPSHSETVVFSDGSSASWLIKPNGDGTYTYQIAGTDPMSAMPVLVTGSL